MIRHQHLDQRRPRLDDARRRGRDLHVRLALADARGGIDARPDVHDADAADADRRLVLLVAERRDRDPVQAGGVEDRRALRDRDLEAVDREGDRLAHARSYPEAHAGLAEALRVRLDLVGEVLHDRRDRHVDDLAEAADGGHLQRVAELLVEREIVRAAPPLRPLRDHLGQLGRAGAAGHALAARLVAEEAHEFSAMSSMQARSSHTTIAPEPTVAPAAVIAFQSSGRSSIDAGR
jgi:hypothetical protein